MVVRKKASKATAAPPACPPVSKSSAKLLRLTVALVVACVAWCASLVFKAYSTYGLASRQPGWIYYDFSEREQGGALKGRLLQTSGVGKLRRQANASFFIQERLASRSTVERLLAQAAALEATFRTDEDSIDSQPTFELYVLERGSVVNNELYSIVKELKEPLVAFVRRVMECPECDLCDVLLRRYRPGERRSVPVHRDINAYATAILTLNADQFHGGYFIADRPDANQKAQEDIAATAYHLAVNSGDVLVHNFDVLHGVNVTDGERVSVVGWFKDRSGRCAMDDNPWVKELADGGDPEAAYVLGDYARQKGNEHDAAKWLKLAAERGHPGGMVFLGQGVFQKKGKAQVEAGRYLLQSASLGRRDGMAMLAWALDNGAGMERNSIEALKWRRKSAKLGHPMAINELQKAGISIDE